MKKRIFERKNFKDWTNEDFCEALKETTCKTTPEYGEGLEDTEHGLPKNGDTLRTPDGRYLGTVIKVRHGLAITEDDSEYDLGLLELEDRPETDKGWNT